MSVSRSVLAIGEPQRIALACDHCGFGDFLEDVRHVRERSNDGLRIALPGRQRLIVSDGMDDALNQLQALGDGQATDSGVDLVWVGRCHDAENSAYRAE
jgi:hypothetical protein